MSLTGEQIKQLLAAGVPPESLPVIAEVFAAGKVADEKLAAEKKERNRIRQAEHRAKKRLSHGVTVTGCDSALLVVTPPNSPLSDSPPFNPPITSEDKSSSVNIPKLQKTSVEAPASSASEKIKPATYPPDFERFWLAYPANRRKDKPDAFVRWKLALKKADAEKIISAASLYSQSKEAIDGFAPYPAKWLKGERFNDETTITIEAKQVLPDSQKAKNLMYLRDTLQKPLDVQQSTWLKTYENQQGGLTNG